MTALCPGGGPSGVKPGVDPSIAIGGYALDAWVTSLGVPELGPYIGIAASGLALTTSVYCASDPPPDPGLNLTDIEELITATSASNYAGAMLRIRDWILYHYWWVVCECTGAATPPTPPPNLPTGQANNTGLPTATLGTTCWNFSLPFTVPASPAGALIPVINLTQLALPQGTQFPIASPPGPVVFHATEAPAGTYSVTGTPMLHDTLPGGTVIDVSWIFYSGSGSAVPGGGTYVFSGTTGNTPWPSPMFFPSTAAGWALYVSNSDTQSHQMSIDLSVTCSSTAPNTLVQPCCPPDPLVQNYLQLILNLVQQLYTTPTTTSTSWTPGTSHPGLSGTGSFVLARGMTGIRAVFTTIPGDIRTTPGTPTFYWSLGFVTPVANTYPLRSLRTVFADQDMPLPPQADSIDYTFPAGVVVTLTELIPA